MEPGPLLENSKLQLFRWLMASLCSSNDPGPKSVKGWEGLTRGTGVRCNPSVTLLEAGTGDKL